MKYLLLFVLVIGLTYTNPTMEEFHIYFEKQLVANAQQDGYDSAIKMANAIKEMTGFDAVKKLSDYLLAKATWDDYYLFSIYKVKVKEKNLMFIGVFSRFIPINKEIIKITSAKEVFLR